MNEEERALADSINKDIAKVRERLLEVRAAMDWADHCKAKGLTPYAVVLAEEIRRLRQLLPHRTPLQGDPA